MRHTYNAIIKLGYRFETGWAMNKFVQDSLEMTAELYRKETAPIIIVSGKWHISFDRANIVPPFTEAETMRQKLRELGVPDSAIIKEEISEDTIGNAYFTKNLIVTQNHYRNLLVIGADFHMPRIKYIFKKVYGIQYRLDFLSFKTPKEIENVTREKELLIKTKEFLVRMKPGEDEYLNGKLYSNDFFNS